MTSGFSSGRKLRVVRGPLLLAAVIVLACATRSAAQGVSAKTTPAPNTLTAQEARDGWKLLWDGKTADGWISAKGGGFPASGWTIQDGELTLRKGGSKGGGDIMTTGAYSEFELMVDYKTDAKIMDSGVKYFVHPVVAAGAEMRVLAAIGYEFQIHNVTLDETAALIKAGKGNRLLGGLYGLLQPALVKGSRPVGQWSNVRIVVKGNHIEHWLNGDKVLEYDHDSKLLRDAVAQSKFKDVPGFAEWKSGYILLQDHGNEISFRNIKIRAFGKPVDPASVKPLVAGQAQPADSD